MSKVQLKNISKSYGKNKSSSQKTGPKYEIKNHFIKSFLKYLHTLSMKLSTISISAKYKTTHEFYNIDANLNSISGLLK